MTARTTPDPPARPTTTGETGYQTARRHFSSVAEQQDATKVASATSATSCEHPAASGASPGSSWPPRSPGSTWPTSSG